MSAARAAILAKVRGAIGGGERSPADTEALEQRLTAPPRGIGPARAQLPHAAQLDLFQSMAEEVSATVVRVPDAAAVPAAVADFLKAENLPAEIRMASDPELETLPWDQQPLLTIGKGPAKASDQVSLTGAFAGIAETGTLVLTSGAERPTSLNFLPETHVVMVKASTVTGLYEDAWDRLRALYGPGEMPRTVNFITGPSRTGDIEQTIQLGAHGPRRLHILLVEDGHE